MLIKIILLTILLTIVFEKIQTQHVQYQGEQFSQFWDSSEESAETKELSSKEFYRKGQDNDRVKPIVNEDVSISISQEDEKHYGGYQKQNQPLTLSLRENNIPKQFPDAKSVSNFMDSNGYILLQDKFKRQITNPQLEKVNYHPVKPLADVSLSMSAETKEFNSAEVLSNKLKRQIQSQSADFNIQGNNNRFFSLINLPLKLNILANVLSVLNQDVVGTKGGAKASDGFSINGNNNRITNFVNLPVDVKAVLNVLSKVNTKSGKSKEEKKNQEQPLNGLLGGLLGGGRGLGNEHLLGGLLGVTSDGLVGDLLGEDLGLDDLLSTLLGNDAEFGHLLGGVFAKDHSHGLLEPLLENLLKAVGSIVEHLLELLTALFEGILKHSLKQSESASGATLSHILTQNGKSPLTNSDFNIRGNNNQITSLINAPIKLKAFINVLSSLKQEISKQIQPNADTNSKSEGSSAQPVKANAATLIQGNNNELSNLLNVKPEVDVKLNLLSQITEILNPVQNENDNVTNETNSNSQFDNSDEICFDVPIQKSETSIVGNNNRISQLLNVQPKLNLDLNVLSQLTQTGGSIPKNIPTQKICIPRPTTQAPLTIPTTTAVTPTTTQNNEICFDIPIEQSATSIRGNNNRISQLANVQPKINLDLNLLSKLTQMGASLPSNIAIQRICIPNPNFQTTTTAIPTTPTPTTPTPTTPTAKTTTAMTSPTNPKEICFDIPIDQSGSSIIGNNNRVFEAVNVNPNVNLVLNLLSQINQSQNSQTAKVPTQRICIPIPTTPKSSTNKPSATPTIKTTSTPTATPTATPSSLPTATPSDRPSTTTATTTPLPPSPTPEKRCFKRVCTRWLQTRDYKCLTKQDQFPKYTFTYTY